jgi:hypothetical protein
MHLIWVLLVKLLTELWIAWRRQGPFILAATKPGRAFGLLAQVPMAESLLWRTYQIR